MKIAPRRLEPGETPSGAQIERLMARGRALRSEALRAMTSQLTNYFCTLISVPEDPGQVLIRRAPGIARRPLGPAGF